MQVRQPTGPLPLVGCPDAAGALIPDLDADTPLFSSGAAAGTFGAARTHTAHPVPCTHTPHQLAAMEHHARAPSTRPARVDVRARVPVTLLLAAAPPHTQQCSIRCSAALG